MKRTVSISNGENAIKHNNRKNFAYNVDKSRTHLNITYAKNDINVMYDKLFDVAWSEYCAKQPPSRQRELEPSYLKHMLNLKNRQKPFYEVVAQVGNCYTCGVGLPGEKIAVKILDEYAKDFEKRNPHLKVLNMVMHRDEDTPHLHIDYIPVGDGYTEGMQKRNSIYRALEQQGIPGDKTKANSKINNWYNSEKAAIAVIMGKYGWEPEVDSGLHLKHKSVETYKTITAIVANEVSQLPQQIKRMPYAFNKEKIIVFKKELDDLERAAKLSVVNSKAISEINKTLQSRAKDIDDYVACRKSEIEEMQQRAKREIATEWRKMKDKYKDLFGGCSAEEGFENQTQGDEKLHGNGLMTMAEIKREIAQERAKNSQSSDKIKTPKHEKWER